MRGVWLSADVDHVARGLQESGFANVVARLLVLDSVFNERGQVGVIAATAEDPVKIVVGLGEEAGADLAVGRESNAAAMAAEWARNRSDNPNFSDAILKGVAARRFTGGVRCNRPQGSPPVEPIDDLVHALAFSDAPDGTPNCQGEAYYTMVKALTCEFADISLLGPDDGKHPCDAASWAWRILDAAPIQLAGVRVEAPPGGGACPPGASPLEDHCDP